MYTIEIDFEVFKAMTARRTSEDVTENDVLREMFGLEPQSLKRNDSVIKSKSWVIKGVEFPYGTKFRATYKGMLYEAVVENGNLILGGKRYQSPSSAAVSITKNPVNGWTFWECQFPGRSNWMLIKSLRRR